MYDYVLQYGFDSVKIEHIAESIRICARITESVRNRQANNLIAAFNNEKKILQNPACKIIQFPTKF